MKALVEWLTRRMSLEHHLFAYFAYRHSSPVLGGAEGEISSAY
jgi:hypothetical protein